MRCGGARPYVSPAGSAKGNGFAADTNRMPAVHVGFGRLVLGVLSVRKSASRQEGQALIEYALIITLIAVVAIAVLQTTGVNLRTLLNKTASDV